MANKHRVRQERAYAAGARDAILDVMAIVNCFPTEIKNSVGPYIEELRTKYPMPDDGKRVDGG